MDAHIVLVIAGATNTGKTSLIHRFVNLDFNESRPTTLRLESGVTLSYAARKTLFIAGKCIRTEICEICSNTIPARSYYRMAQGVLLVYDGACIGTLSDLYREIESCTKRGVPVVLVASKIDREADCNEGEAFAKRNDLAGFLKTSAKTGANVKEAFELLIKKVLENSELYTSLKPTKTEPTRPQIPIWRRLFQRRASPEQADNTYIAMEEQSVEIDSKSLSRAYSRMSQIDDIVIRKGELLIQKRNLFYVTYRGKEGAPFKYDAEDTNIVALDSAHYVLLEAIETPEERFCVFNTEGWRYWGAAVQKYESVYISVPMNGNSKCFCSTARICYIGKLDGNHTGTWFGVEITDSRYYGCGTSDGTYHGVRYFSCKKNNGLFLTLASVAYKPEWLKLQLYQDSDIQGDDISQNASVSISRSSKLCLDSWNSMLEEQEAKRKQAERERDQAVRDREQAERERDQAVRDQDHAMRERDQVVRERDQAVRERDQAVREHNQTKSKRDQAVREHNQTKSKRDQAVKECDQTKRERDQAVKECDQTKRERDQAVMECDQTKRERDQAVKECDQTKRERDQAVMEHNQTKKEHDQTKKELEALREEHSRCRALWIVPRHHVMVTEKILGGGAWGYVKEGKFSGQQVAVKCVHEAIINQHTMKRVYREICTMSQVHHPNLVLFIAAVLDDQGGPMIITELLDTTLRKAYEDNLLKPGLDQCVAILRDVASALCYLHELEVPIIHRDVSSANVLMKGVTRNTWTAKLSDFGSANWARQACTRGEGAIVYTAPEAYPTHPSLDVKPPPQTTKIDVYSYGILLCEITLREFPNPDTLNETMAKMKARGASLHSMMQKCILKEPTQRPTMAKILQDLNEIGFTLNSQM